jgi:hypothetical protein
MKAILILYNKKGMSILECVVALLLTTTAFVSLMFMQPLAWKGASKSDYLGRAEGILQRELESREGDIRWGTPGAAAVTTCADASGNSITCGTSSTVFNITYTPTIPAGTTTTYLINVRVTWTGNVNGIRNSMIVSR